MRKFYLLTTLFLVFLCGWQANAQYCGPLEFTFDVEPITRVQVADIDNVSDPTVNGSPAHEDFTAIVGNMEQGTTYPIALEGNTAGNWTNRFVVFIDWNQNGILDDAGEVFEMDNTITNSTGTDGQQALGNIVVPEDALEGETRMRVKKIFGTTDFLDPCLGAQFGQAEDYTIEVTGSGGGGGTDCETTPGIVINDDGTIENGMSGNPAVVTEMIFADKFTPSGYPATIESVCSAFVTLAGGTPDLPYDIVVYDDDGAGGAPGTLIGEMTGLTANGIPVYAAGAPPVWQSEITSSENWEITDGSVYIGVRFAPTTPNHYIASDESTTTPLVGGYWWNDNAGVWQTIQAAFPNYRALFIRPVLEVGASDPCAVTVFPFTETFENDSESRDCWSQIQVAGAANWTYQTGSSGGTVTTAHQGTLNARFVSLNGVNSPITKLVSPTLDLTSLVNPQVRFYYAQEDWAGDQNELKVYYRVSDTDPWVQIAHYTSSINTWTEEILLLPNPSSTYQIAFEGINNWGRANVVDTVTIEESGGAGDCGTVFTDSGGAGGNYSNNENTTWTFHPGDPGNEVIVATFTEFNVEDNWDVLYVYDGPDTSAPLIDSGNPPTGGGFPAGGYWGTDLIGPFTSTHATGALTFVFRSDFSLTRPGWVADITCESIVPVNNDDCDNAFALNCGDIVTGTTVGMNNSGGNSAPDVFYSYTGSGVQEQVTVSLCGSAYDTYLRVYSDCTLSNQIAFNDDFCGLQSQLSFISDGTSTYFIMVEGFSSNAGNYTLEITCVADDPILNDDCDDAIPLQCGDTHSGSTTFATNSGGNAAPDVFYSFTGNGETEFVTVSLCGSSYDTYLRVYSDCTLSNQIAFNDDSCGLQSQLTFESDGFSTYYIMVEGFSSSSGDYVIEITCTGIPGCGDLFTDTGGETGNYSSNEDIWWTFTPDVPGDIVTVTFSQFDIENNWDYLFVYDGLDGSAPLIATLTGNTIPGPFSATNPDGALTFNFVSDGSITFPGWVALIECGPYVEPNDECDDAIALSCGDTVSGDTSFASDSGMNPSADVFYTYTGTGTPEIVTLSLCGSSYDTYVRVFTSCDLTQEIAHNDDFCGLQSQVAFMSDGTSTYVIMVEGFGSQFGAFNLDVSCVESPGCGEQFTDTGGNSGNYGSDEDIVWTFTPNAGEVATLTFTSFDVEAQWDALYVYDGPDTNSPLIDSGNPATGSGFPAGGYWGNTIPGPFTSTHPSGALTVRFMSDGSVQNSGWTADITCGVVGMDNNSIEGLVFYPNPMNNLLNIQADTTIDTVTIYNVLGQVVLFQNVNTTSVQLNVSELASGSYMMKITSEGSTETHQVVRR